MRLVRHCHRLPRAVAESPPAEMLRPRHREVLLLLLHPDPTAHTKAGAARCNLCHHRQQHADGSGAEPQWDGLARTTRISLPRFTTQPAQPPSVNSRASRWCSPTRKEANSQQLLQTTALQLILFPSLRSAAIKTYRFCCSANPHKEVRPAKHEAEAAGLEVSVCLNRTEAPPHRNFSFLSLSLFLLCGLPLAGR